SPAHAFPDAWRTFVHDAVQPRRYVSDQLPGRDDAARDVSPRPRRAPRGRAERRPRPSFRPEPPLRPVAGQLSGCPGEARLPVRAEVVPPRKPPMKRISSLALALALVVGCNSAPEAIETVDPVALANSQVDLTKGVDEIDPAAWLTLPRAELARHCVELEANI